MALRQCRGAVWRHWYSVAELSGAEGTEAVRGDLTTKLMADLQLQQQDPVLGPALAAWPAKLSNMKERSTRALVQQYPPSWAG